jgi:hypothetical protein
MNKIIGVTLAAATLGGAVLTAAGPAAARDWGGDRGGHAEGGWHGGDRGGWRGGDHGGDHWRGGWGWRDHDGWRWGDHDWGDGWRWQRGAYYFGYGPSCYNVWRWDPYWGRNVRVTYCD